MKKSVLQSLIELFVYLAKLNSDNMISVTRFFVSEYLRIQLGERLHDQYITFFDTTLSTVQIKKGIGSKKQKAVFSVKILKICESFNRELDHKQKILVLIKILELAKYINAVSFDLPGNTKSIDNVIRNIADTMNIPYEEKMCCQSFIMDTLYKCDQSSHFLMIGDVRENGEALNYVQHPGLSGKITFMHLQGIDEFMFRYSSKSKLLLNGHPIYPNQVYLFTKGGSIKGLRADPVYYNDVATKFLSPKTQNKTRLTVDEISYIFKKSNNGIRKFSIVVDSGQMIGVMGGSGTGKSTLLYLLTGKLKPQHGKIYINGYDLNKNIDKLTPVIGFVPQDDLLFENLSVYENLYYNARLCFSKDSKERIKRIVDDTLDNLGLNEIKELPVGTPLNKIISGGQRKRLNIALELIREPNILFIDEPTSGLSSKDSEHIMDVLKSLTLKGLIVIVNIHQPSSDIFKLFNKILLLDVGGYPIYYGEPLESIAYFKKALHQADEEHNECETCGNVNPEQLFDYIEAKTVNEVGEFTRQRKNPPIDWYIKFRDVNKPFVPVSKTELPIGKYKIPKRGRQFLVFFIRNLKSKMSDTQYLTLSFVIAPLLAVMLGVFTKYFDIRGEEPFRYIFSKNDNIPSFLFMSIVVALFVGMIISAEELFSDRKIRERERFLKLSESSYINAKISFLFIMSAFQTFLYVAISNAILGIKGMFVYYMIIIFSTFCYANLLGLIISKYLKSIISIYIIIPLLLIPQLLLGGTMIKFDKINYKLTSFKYVPFAANFTASRWAFEALAVAQFKDNPYQKDLYGFSKEISNMQYENSVLIPYLTERIDQIVGSNAVEPKADFNSIKFMINCLSEFWDEKILSYINILQDNKYNDRLLNNLREDLVHKKKENLTKISKLEFQRDNIIEGWNSLAGKDGMSAIEMKNKYHNEALEELVLNKKEFEKASVIDNRIIRKFEPLYAAPRSKIGRTQYYSSRKRILGEEFDTVIYNTSVIWLMIIFMYLILIGKTKYLIIPVARIKRAFGHTIKKKR